MQEAGIPILHLQAMGRSPETADGPAEEWAR